MTAAMAWSERHGRAVALGVGVVLVAPLLVAMVALRTPRWYPVLDLAMTEFRVRDVFTAHTPLIGLPGRIGNFPDQGSHPGPLSFYLLAPLYRALGSTSWALLVSTLTVNAAAIAATVAIAFRRGGVRLVLGVGLLLALLLRGYGISTVAEPWNPYMPLLWWIATLVAIWSVLLDDLAVLPFAVFSMSVCAQTHVPYLGLGIGMAGLVALALVVSVRRRHGRDRRRAFIVVASSLVFAAVLWSPLVVDQVRNEPGNLSMLWHHFTSPPEEPVGARTGVELELLHLDAWSFLQRGNETGGSLVRASSDPDGSVIPGVVTVAVWALSVVLAVRRRLRPVLALDAVVAVGIVLAAYSMGRIFGKIWYYLMLWAWAVTGMLVLAIVWTLVAELGARLPERRRLRAEPVALGVLAAAAVVASTLTATKAAAIEPPAPRLSKTLAEVMPETATALDDGVKGATGKRGTYLVTWSDAFYIGSQGYGVVDELERRGYHVGVPDPWRVPVTHHRVLDEATVTAKIHFTTGYWIDRWRQLPDAQEVAYYDPRTPAQRAEFERLRTRVISDLRAQGLDEIVEQVDGNLFGATLEPRLHDDVRKRMERMLYLGLPAAVFIATPGAHTP